MRTVARPGKYWIVSVRNSAAEADIDLGRFNETIEDHDKEYFVLL